MNPINSTLESAEQAVTATLDVPGTDLQLEYDSRHAYGNARKRRLEFPISDDSVPSRLSEIAVTVEIAGQTHEQTYDPAPNLVHTFVWDGRDGRGRPVRGTEPVKVQVDYDYEREYSTASSTATGNSSGDGGSGGGTSAQSFGQRNFGSDGQAGEAVSVRQSDSGSVSGATVSRNWQGALEAAWGQNDAFGGWTASRQRTLSWALDRMGSEPIIDTFVKKERLTDTPHDPLPFRIPATDEMAVGSDGTLYFANYEKVFKFEPGGPFTHIGGHEYATDWGDGGPATEADISVGSGGIAVGSDGSVYIAESFHAVVRRIDPDGIIETVAGSRDVSAITANEDLGMATDTSLGQIEDITVGPDGDLYVVEISDSPDSSVSGAVRRVTPSGRIVPVVGGGSGQGSTDGGSATEAELDPLQVQVDANGTVYTMTGGYYDQILKATAPDGQIRTVDGVSLSGVVDSAIGPHGVLYLSDQDRPYQEGVVKAVLPNGGTEVVLGNGEQVPNDRYDPIPDNTPATKESFPLSPIATRSDGTLLFRDEVYSGGHAGEPRGPVRGVSTAWLGGIPDVIPSRDGRVAHVFESNQHVRSVDALTGATRTTIERDADGRSAAFADESGNRVVVERDDQGRLSAIEAPTGQRTTFATDENGYLESATLPDGRTVELDHSADGLLTQLKGPRGDITQFAYDESGRAVERTDARGNTTDLVRTELDDGKEVTSISPEMRETTHRAERVDGKRQFVRTCCDGAQRTTTVKNSGERQTTWADGRSRTVQWGPDPRFGLAAAVPEREVENSPGGRTSITTTERTVSLADPNDPLSLSSFAETVTINGRSYERSFEGTGPLRTTSPEGRIFDIDFDETGLHSELTLDGIDPWSLGYDSGKLTELTQTGATTAFEYNADGNLAAAVDATGNRTELEYADHELPTEITTSTGETHDFEYDDSGNLIGFARPNGDVHGFSYDPTDALSEYTLPGGGTESLSYDGDGLLTELVRPSGRTVTNSYDSGARRVETTTPEASVTRTRDAAHRVTKLVRSPSDGGTDQTLSYEHDGRVVTELAYNGVVSGTFQYSHDADGAVTDITYPDGTTHSLTRNDDGMATKYGPFSITRQGPNGRVSEIRDETVTVALSYDSRGRIQSRTHTVDGTTVYDVSYGYDTAGRITDRTETVAGTTQTEAFEYDDADRLVSVERGDNVVETYGYDPNGNQISRTDAGATESATYKQGDQLVQYGGTNYTHDADGFITGRGSATFTFSTTGELIEATTADGETVTYYYDGTGRRVARTDSAGTTEYLYGDPTRPNQVTVARDPDGTRTRYHYDPLGRMVAFERGGDWFYVATDQVGTPRVVTAADGTVVRKIDRDSFGAVRSDTAPDVTLHVGFAGGIPDPATGLVRFGQRDYEPTTGRWTARDPLLLTGGQFNFYAYARNDPVNFLDRTGLSCHTWADRFKRRYDQTTATPVDELLSAGGGAYLDDLIGAAYSAILGKSLSKAVGGGFVGSIATSAAAGAIGQAVIGSTTVAAIGGAALTGGALAAAALGGIAIGSAIGAAF